MQQTLNMNWWQRSRMNGILRYQYITLRSVLRLTLIILLVSQALSLLMPFVFDMNYQFAGIYADISITLVVALICAQMTANKSTTFLLRFGTSRTAVWLGNLISLFLGMIALLLATLLLSMVSGATVQALESAFPDKYMFDASFYSSGTSTYSDMLTDALRDLPKLALYAIEWSSLFYLLGCCMRRNRALTLIVIIGVPMLFMILMMIPAVRNVAQVIDEGNQGKMMLEGAHWLKILTDVMKFVQTKWQYIKAGAALISLPLSYLCMRGTPQPDR